MYDDNFKTRADKDFPSFFLNWDSNPQLYMSGENPNTKLWWPLDCRHDKQQAYDDDFKARADKDLPQEMYSGLA